MEHFPVKSLFTYISDCGPEALNALAAIGLSSLIFQAGITRVFLNSFNPCFYQCFTNFLHTTDYSSQTNAAARRTSDQGPEAAIH
jgi:hypothetical protein